MIITHFKMTSQPFRERIPVDHIIKNDQITQGIAKLEYIAENGTIALLTGLSGVGKSTLIKLFLSTLPQNRFMPIYIHFTPVKSSSLLKLIVTKLGEVPKSTKEQTFLQIIDKCKKINLTILLLIDEAHLLESDSITVIRLLISSALDEDPPLKIIFSGQEGIKPKLRRSSHTDLIDRISVKHHMKLLTKNQTEVYIDSQMKYAGSSEKVFDPEVKDIIYEYSNGNPRIINNIATGCLINSTSHGIKRINLEILNQTMKELQS